MLDRGTSETRGSHTSSLLLLPHLPSLFILFLSHTTISDDLARGRASLLTGNAQSELVYSSKLVSPNDSNDGDKLTCRGSLFFSPSYSLHFFSLVFHSPVEAHHLEGRSQPSSKVNLTLTKRNRVTNHHTYLAIRNPVKCPQTLQTQTPPPPLVLPPLREVPLLLHRSSPPTPNPLSPYLASRSSSSLSSSPSSLYPVFSRSFITKAGKLSSAKDGCSSRRNRPPLERRMRFGGACSCLLPSLRESRRCGGVS